jgi:DNA polymerase III alpha subunit
MNAYAHAQLWVEAYNKKAEKKFKYIPGLEGYFHPNLEEWKKLKEKHEEEKNTKKEEKRKQSSKEKIKTSLSVKTDANEDIEEIDITNNLVLEDEETSKSNKHFNPLNRRHHLVVLPINSQGLIDLFGLVSKSYLKGFYRYPRFDANDLKEASKNGNLITSSACLHPDSELITNFGKLTIKDAIKKISRFKKPIYIFSMSCAEGPLKELWIKDAISKIRNNPLISGWIWFNENKEKNWLIWSDDKSLEAFKDSLN